jgi:uncharacterized protein YoxC
MSGGDIAGLVAAGVFAILVALIAIPLIKLGKVFDETSAAIRDLSSNVTPLLEEATTTISESNKQLGRLDTITGDIAETTGNVTALVSLFAASVGGPLIKVAAFSAGVRAALGGLGPRTRKGSAKSTK